MSRVLVILGRLFVIIVAYAFAALAASAFLHVMTLGELLLSAAEFPDVIVGSIAVSIPFVTLFVAYLAFVPAAVAIAIGEILGARDWLYYAIAGAIAAGVAVALFWHTAPEPVDFGGADAAWPQMRLLDDPRIALAILGAGMIAGLAYWVIAGRSAGNWRRGHQPPISPAP